MLRSIIDRLIRTKQIEVAADITTVQSDQDEITLNQSLTLIKHQIKGSGVLDKIVEILNTIDYQYDDLNAELIILKNEFISPNLESSIRIIRWDGRVIAHKGTVVSRYQETIMINTMTGEYAIEIVISAKPQIDAKYRILWIGLDYAGKTTLLHKLRYNEYIKPKRTVGQELEDVILEGLRITNIDLGGQKALRSHWGRFPLVPQIIVFVIDILDEGRFNEAYDALKEQVITNERYNELPLLIVINKIDEYKESIEPITHITRNIDLLSLLHDRTWQLKPVSALTGEGLDEIIEILTKFLLNAETA